MLMMCHLPHSVALLGTHAVQYLYSLIFLLPVKVRCRVRNCVNGLVWRLDEELSYMRFPREHGMHADKETTRGTHALHATPGRGYY
jgi:hypothetical protein